MAIEKTLSPSHTWSPHKAALHRRRRLADKEKDAVLGSLGGLDLEDAPEEDFLAKTKTNKKVNVEAAATKAKHRNTVPVSGAEAASKAAAKRELSEAELKKSIETFSPTLQRKLLKFIDPSTPMKERIELEVEMMRDPDERKIFADFRYKAERKNLLVKKASIEEEVAQQVAKNLEEEAKRAKEEKKNLDRKRKEKVDEEVSKKEREARLKEEIRKHKAQAIAADAEELRKNAEKVVHASKENKARKERIQAERERREREFREGPGRHMTDVERELHIARMMQVEIEFSDDE